MEGLKARLSLLEVMVSRLSGGDTVPPGGRQAAGAKAQPELQEALNQAVGERNLLRGEKERLEREVEGLQRRVEEMRRETESLRNKPCPNQTPAVPLGPAVQDRAPVRPSGGKGYTAHARRAITKMCSPSHL